MKKATFAVIFVLMLFGTIAISYAEPGDWHGGIRDRIQRAEERIDRGIDQGSLTRHEAGRLKGELGQIMRKIDRMKADGRFDHRERERINRDLDRLERNISREKHHGDNRGHGYR